MRVVAVRLWTLVGCRLLLALLAIAPAIAAPTRPRIGPPGFGPRAPASDAAADDDHSEPFVPKTLRSEADSDRLEALQLFAAGRLKEQKQQLPAALRFYQRAYRRDPAAVAVLKQIIPLAFNLGRSEEAFRYAMKLGAADPTDPVLLRQLGVHLAGEGKLAEALSFYEQAWKLERERGKKAPNTVLLLAQLGKLYLVADRPERAAEIYAEALLALDKPDEYKLDNRTRRMVFDDAAKTLALLGVDTADRGDEASAYELFGQTFLQAKRIDEAQKCYERALQLKPDAAREAWLRAQLAAARDDYPGALTALEPYFAAKRQTHGLEPYELLEQGLAKQEPPGPLLERLAQLAAADPENPLLKFFLAERYRRADQLAQAEPLYAQLAESKPSLDVYQAQVDLYRRERNVPKLMQTLATCLAQLRLFDLLGESGKSVLADEALVDELFATADKRLAEAPDQLSADQRTGLATLALAAERIDVAATWYESALAATPDQSRELLRRWGLGLLVQDRAAEAVAVFARVPADEKPLERAQRLYHLAGAYELAGKSDEALAAARESATLAESEKEALGDAYYAIVSRVPWVLFHAKRYDAARTEYLALLERFEKQLDDKGARTIAREMRMMLSNLAAIQNDLSQAEEWLEQVLDEAPDDVSASNDLGYLWVDQGKHLERSLRMIQFAVAEAPDNGAYRDSLGWAWYRLGKYDQAVTELRKALELLEEPDGVILDHLGDALSKAGRADEARTFWERAATSFDKDQEPEKAQAARRKLSPLAPAIR